MIVLDVEHSFPCDVDTFWRNFFDDELNRAIFINALAFPQYFVSDNNDNGEAIQRRIEVTPRVNVALARGLVAEQPKYVEIGIFDRKTKIYRFQTAPADGSNRLSTQGHIVTAPEGGQGCRRVVQLTIKSPLFGLGPLIERIAARAASESLEAVAQTARQLYAPRR